ncbi:hypothetical protein [Altererythrobacter lutimaris]|uniref:Uncharacterized protein n=1 Tax=Altererythrobacter lutimaris TaxID=2743979 RepID=A0A850HC38_9SPHN|nr:hypothetical protein [Altererythrobacter lutimaris]NVE94855.1 hypothetical protein [Altererythrobacter lutimaris]
MDTYNPFRLWRRWRRFGAIDPAKMSRINYLFWLSHHWLEGERFKPGGLNISQLVEKQIRDGELQLGTHNMASQVAHAFRLALLYWGQGDVEQAEKCLRTSLNWYSRLMEVCAEHNRTLEFPREIHFAKCAACLLDEEFIGSPLIGDLDMGYEPWFKDTLMDYCLGQEEFDWNHWQVSVDQWTKSRFPKYRIEEFAFYARVLTGEFETSEAMFAEHQKLITAKSKRNPDADLQDGYGEYAALVTDYIFAAILKRIGWEGKYRHSWPNTDVMGAPPQTTREPDRFLKAIALKLPDPDAETGIIADIQQARRFIDTHLEDQRDEEGEFFDPKRSKKERSKVAAALKEVGWVRDPATLDLMRTYDVENILNDQSPLVLGDPFGSDIDLKDSTEFLQQECGLSDEFIGIAGNIEAYHPDTDGGWYLYRKKDRKVYLLDREDWEEPHAAIKAAREGLNMWPSYTSFVAWWVAQHLAAAS